MKKENIDRTPTKSEMEIMNILWDNSISGMTTHEVIDRYPEPKPAYTTIATFLKIMTEKGFISYKKSAAGGRSFYFYPLLSRVEYTRKCMSEVKNSFFAGSIKSLISFFAKEENVSDEELDQILSIIYKEEKEDK